MSLFDAFRFDGRRALVVGGATGMGAAAVEVLQDAGAQVAVMDRAAIPHRDVTAVEVDLADAASIAAGVRSLDAPLDALLCCAGVADGTPGIERINFLGHRLLVELLLEAELLTRGAAIGMISSAAGFGWEQNRALLDTYLAIADFDEAAAWARDHGRADYLWSKLAINAYVAAQAMPLLARGIRINATLPGPTDTPLARANADTWLAFGADYREATGAAASTALEQAYPLVFLCSRAAAGISGITLVADSGYLASGTSGAFAPAADAVGFFRSEF